MTNEPKAPTKGKTAADLRAVLKDMPDDERRKASIQMGTQLPKIDEKTDREVRVFGYRCKSCNDIGLEFLGDSWEVWQQKGPGEPDVAVSFPYPPTHVPLADLRWVQDGPPKSPSAKLRVSRNRSDPICQHCGNALAKGPDGGINPNRVVKLDEWRTLRAEDERRAKTPAFRYDRDAKPNVFPAATRQRGVES